MALSGLSICGGSAANPDQGEHDVTKRTDDPVHIRVTRFIAVRGFPVELDMRIPELTDIRLGVPLIPGSQNEITLVVPSRDVSGDRIAVENTHGDEAAALN
jgi:hypothetical protein